MWKAPAVGDEIDSICSRCREETIHRLVAMVGAKIHLVICTRCGSQHRYRPSLEAMGRKVPLPSERQARVLKKVALERARQTQRPLEDWEKLVESALKEEPLPYDQRASFLEQQALAHPSFGLGFVRRVISTTKIEVVFEHQVKILAMNRPK